MSRLVKIDRVQSASEAEAIEALGADLISASLGRDPRFADDRMVSIDTAASIRQSLKRARYVGELDFGEHPAQSLDVAKTIGFDLVQPISGKIPPLAVRRALQQAGIGIVYATIEVSHDDDPSWILSRFNDDDELDAAYFQIDLLPEYADSWDFLKNESPAYEDEIQIEDINHLAEEHDLLVTLDFSPENVVEIISAMPNIKGISIVMGTHPVRDDLHYADYPVVLQILNALRG